MRRTIFLRLVHHLHRRRRLVVTLALGVIGAACGLFLGAGLLSRATPAWWRDIDPEDPADRAAAAAIESLVVTELNRVRPTEPGFVPSPGGPSWQSAPWEIAVPAHAASAWLTISLPKWAANRSVRWPGEIQGVEADFREELVRFGARLGSEARSQHLSASFSPRVDEHSALWLRARWLFAGRLPIPPSWVLSRAETALAPQIPASLRARPETGHFARALAGEAPLHAETSMRLADGRRVRVLELRAEREQLIVRCRTEKR